MCEWHKSIKERVGLFKSFHRMENARPLLGFFRGSEYPLFRYPFAKSLPMGKPLVPTDFNVMAFVDNCENLFLEHEECGGDFMFSASAFWGIPWLEAALGLPIFADQNTGSIYCESPVDFKLDVLPVFSASNQWMSLMAEMLGALAERSSGRFPLATTRMRGVSDLLSALYGGEGFIFAMLEKPNEVKEASKLLTDFFIQCGKLQLTHIPDFHGGIGSFYYHMWAPKETVWHQEDAVALISPALYEEFIEPCDKRIVQSFEHVIIHQHSTGFVPTGKYIDMGMSVLEMHIDTGGPSAEELYNRHAAILEKNPLLIWGDIPEKDLDWIFRKLPSKGLAVITVVENSEEAGDIWRRYLEW
jgi:hypothetical protein